LRAFSQRSFSAQLQVPGVVVLEAICEGEVVGAQLYYQMGDVVQCHLGASSPLGYQVGVTYALDWTSIEYFSGKAKWLDLGGGAGVASDGLDGLSSYKQGWATETRMAYFCGRIFNRPVYQQLAGHGGMSGEGYFPAYRKGEFG
jgi:lipid II:glycine glycyltransferase (peptidoglycan interpeptide bridge formation enzyme)